MGDSNRNGDATVAFDSDISTNNAGAVDFEPAATVGGTASDQDTQESRGAKQTLKDEAGKLGQQATERARGLVDQGKARATGALDEFAKMMDDAAGNVDEKIGEQYGQYARSAAQALSGFSDQIRDKDVEDLIADAREFVRKSPAIAVGTAAALGFLLARLVKAGVDTASDAVDTDKTTRA